MVNHPNRATENRKLIREWSDAITVGIYDNSTWRVRMYDDRAVVTMPTVRWTSQSSGGYHEDKYRIEGVGLERLKDIYANEQADDEDYTDTVYDYLMRREGRY